MELLEGYLEKCRYCLEDLSIGKESILIDEDTDKLFQALIDTKVGNKLFRGKIFHQVWVSILDDYLARPIKSYLQAMQY